MASTQGSGQQPDLEDASHQRTSALRTEALRAPLATILGHTQYLKRAYLNARPVSPDEYLAALATIERSVWALEGHLRVLENDRHPPHQTGE